MTDTKTLTFTRTLPATNTRAYAALTRPEDRAIWGAPDADSVVLIKDQPTPAPGVRETSLVGPAGNPYVTVQTDWIILTPARITYAETLEAEGEAFATSLAILDLTPAAGQTHLTATILIASYAGPEVLPEVESGWSYAMDALTRHLT